MTYTGTASLDHAIAHPVDEAFRHDIIAGLTAERKATPPIWFYDREGSELFDQITFLEEYYPARAETAILEAIGPQLRSEIGLHRCVVEFGAGSLTKTPLLLNQICPSAYIPIDISGDYLRESARTLAEDFPHLPIVPVEADFTQSVSLPPMVGRLPRLGFFPGSTIGNFEPDHAVDLLRSMRASLGEGAMLLIGMDRVKSRDILIPAYDDAKGVTAAFNLNLLHRINRELDAEIPVEAFVHEARWNDDAARVEMHLVARRAVSFELEGRRISLTAGESIHTESSHKYDERSGRLLLRAGGWEPVREWTDPDGLFSIHLARVN